MPEPTPPADDTTTTSFEHQKKPESTGKIALRLLKKAPDLADDPANALKGQFGEIVEKIIYAFLGLTQTLMHSLELYEAYGEFNQGTNRKSNAWIILLAATGIGFAVTLLAAGLASLLPALAFLDSGILIPMNILFLISSSLLVNIFFAKFMVTLHEWREVKKQKEENAPSLAEIRKEAIHNFIQLAAGALILTCNMLMNFVPALDITIFTTMGIPLSPPALIAMVCSLIGMTNELLRGADLGALKGRFKSLESHLMLKLFAGVVCIACLVLDVFPLNLPSVPFLNISLPVAVFLASVAVVISDLIVMGLSAYSKKPSDQQSVVEGGDLEEGSIATPGLASMSKRNRSGSTYSSTSDEDSNSAGLMHHRNRNQMGVEGGTDNPQVTGTSPEKGATLT